MRINLKRPGIKDLRRCIFNDLVDQMIYEYDLDNYRTKEWVKTGEGLSHFIVFLTALGFKVKTFSWPDDKNAVSSGIEFDDDDPLLIAMKLKYAGEDTK